MRDEGQKTFMLEKKDGGGGVRGLKCMVREEDWTLDGGHTI